MIITITNSKGGIGKTTLVHNIGAGLGLRGIKTLLIDLDPQRNLTYCTGAKRDGLTSYEALKNGLHATQHLPLFDIVAGSPALALNDFKPGALAEFIKPLKTKYDLIIFDTAPGLSLLAVQALSISDFVLVPVQAEPFSLQAVLDLSEAVQSIRDRFNPGLQILGIAITRFNSRSILAKDMLDTFRDQAARLGTRLFSANIREGVTIREAQALQKSIFEYAPKSKQAEEINHLLDEITESIKSN